MAKEALIVDSERLQQLREVLQALDPLKRKAWILEVFDRRDGADVLRGSIDIKTGRPWREKTLKQGAEGEPTAS